MLRKACDSLASPGGKTEESRHRHQATLTINNMIMATPRSEILEHSKK